MTENPCRNCPERHVGCHADCEKYAKMREEAKKKRTETKKDKGLAMSRTFLVDSAHKRNKKNGYNGFK